jgi:hypothetical protein
MALNIVCLVRCPSHKNPQSRRDSGNCPRWHTGWRTTMPSYHHHYDFRFGEENAGTFEICDDGGHITMNACFTLDGELLENPFELKYDGDTLLACKARDEDWVDLTSLPDNHFPSCAYPLLLPRVQDRLEYQAVSDSDGSIQGLTVLTREGNLITETHDGNFQRSFLMEDDIPIEINWNGPISHRRAAGPGSR